MSKQTWITATAIVGALALGLTGCGDDQGADVRTIGGGDGSGSASASASGVTSGSASAVAAAERECVPVGEDLEADADETVDLVLRDYEFDPDTIEVPAGVVTFATENEGQDAHELAFLPGGGEVPLMADGTPDEDALAAAGAFEMEAYGPGQSCNATFDLAADEYTIFCLVEAADGATHAEKGMVGTLTVE